MKTCLVKLSNFSIKQHLVLALVLGLVLRLLCAYFDYGPFALDDYLHGLIPSHLLVDYHIHDLPDYRSWLLVWILSAFLNIGKLFGVTEAVSEIRVMLVGLSFFSLIGIYGCYLYVKNFNDKLYATMAIYLVALFPIMPLISTRAFGEAVAMSVLLFGVGIAENARFNNKSCSLILGLFIMGLSCLFRFHIGLFWIGYAVCILIVNFRKSIVPIIVSGILLLISQALVDVLSNRAPFATVFSYLHINEGGAAGYGVTPWYSTWLLVLAFVLVPFSLGLFKNIKSLFKTHWVVFIPFLIFVIAHSMVPHKEERFMFPIVGVELMLFAWLWAYNYNAKAMSVKIFNYALFILGIPALFLVSFVNFQSGAIDPMFKSHADVRSTLVLADGWNTWNDFYKIILTPDSKVMEVNLSNNQDLQKISESFNHSYEQMVIVSSNPDLKDVFISIANKQYTNLHCGDINYASSLLDSVAYTLNPSHNKRRAPAMYIICK